MIAKMSIFISEIPKSQLNKGDYIFLESSINRNRIAKSLDYMSLNYDTNRPGIGKIIQVGENYFHVKIWEHIYRIKRSTLSNTVQRVHPWLYHLSFYFWAETLLRSEIAESQIFLRTYNNKSNRLTSLWLKKTRGSLPIITALDGRVRWPILRRLRAGLRVRLARWGFFPWAGGFGDWGLLMDQIGVEISFEYHGIDRILWLNQIRLHRNGNIHLTGIDLEEEEIRTYRLDKIYNVSVPGAENFNSDDFYWEIYSLVHSRRSWKGIWDNLQDQNKRPTSPDFGFLGLSIEAIGNYTRRIIKIPSHFRNLRLKLKESYARLKYRCRRFSRRIIGVWRYRTAPPLALRVSYGAKNQFLTRLKTAILNLQQKKIEHITCLHTLKSIVGNTFLSRFYLKFLLEAVIIEARNDEMISKKDLSLLTDILTLSFSIGTHITLAQRQKAYTLYEEAYGRQPGMIRLRGGQFRRRGQSRFLLFAESYLASLYNLTPNLPPHRDLEAHEAPYWESFYRANAYFLSSWSRKRFTFDAKTVVRLKLIVAWWSDPADAP